MGKDACGPLETKQLDQSVIGYCIIELCCSSSCIVILCFIRFGGVKRIGSVGRGSNIGRKTQIWCVREIKTSEVKKNCPNVVPLNGRLPPGAHWLLCNKACDNHRIRMSPFVSAH